MREGEEGRRGEERGEGREGERGGKGRRGGGEGRQNHESEDRVRVGDISMQVQNCVVCISQVYTITNVLWHGATIYSTLVYGVTIYSPSLVQCLLVLTVVSSPEK